MTSAAPGVGLEEDEDWFSTDVLIEDCTVAVGSVLGAPTYIRMTELSLLVVVIVPQLEVIKKSSSC